MEAQTAIVFVEGFGADDHGPFWLTILRADGDQAPVIAGGFAHRAFGLVSARALGTDANGDAIA